VLVLSLFPGIGLLDRAFEAEGFCVVRGPDLIWGGDIRTFHPPSGRFDGVIGGPPCQLFSILKRLNPQAGEKHGNMIPEFERVVREAQPTWFLMENVPAAPAPNVQNYWTHNSVILDGEVGGATLRTRRFSFGTHEGRFLSIETRALWRTDLRPAILAGGGGREVPVAIGGSGKRKPLADGSKRRGPHAGPRTPVADMLEQSGFPRDMLDECPLTVVGKMKAVGNGVPFAMGRAVAQAVKRFVESRAA
jgi:DNA (cytosine-5)-methyltransferase 1